MSSSTAKTAAANAVEIPAMNSLGMPALVKLRAYIVSAHQLLGDAYKEGVLELNASDERGIDVVRNKIKAFAQKKVTLPKADTKSDQQQVPTEPGVVDDEPSLPISGTRSNPYLAYPELGSPAFHESVASVNSYDMVEDDDLPLETEIPVTPLTTPSRRSGLLTPSSFRGFSYSIPVKFTSRLAGASSGTAPRTPSIGRLFPRAPRSSTSSSHGRHTRSSSLSTLNILGKTTPSPPPRHKIQVAAKCARTLRNVCFSAFRRDFRYTAYTLSS
ncbi:p-loop containing nucleoside triphosphate hydrolase protein [Mycena sanguinolenta]|uniref:p-loop containing nucleoside triphosphate hydrolase protein n=1 Tax=Mycena sanguinolenta TaxID=230812 RepID=A0A8H7CJ96_9AGAR|nr:p-loop containing nucleoside triphosphate hydrolase protein [Mycena sanguinolenta]